MSLQTDHAFTIGVEEEYQIIDPQSRGLSQSALEIYPLAHALLGDAVQYEMILSQIEIATPICHTLADIQRELVRLRSGVITAADQVQKLIAAGGTHPFSHWKEQTVTPKARYMSLVETYRQMIREQIIFGCHIHIGIPDREVAMQVANRARLWLTPLIALTANSPFWLGEDTGYQDYRTGLWWTVPLSGPPPHFESYQHYKQAIQRLLDTHSIDDPTKVYWDLRISERFPTLEFRVTDVCMTVDEAVMVAGLVRALVRTCYQQAINNVEIPQISTDYLRALHWRAARYGLNDTLVDIPGAHCVPAREYIENFLTFLQPALEAEGDWEEVSQSVRTILEQGNGATRQLAIYQQSGDMKSVVDYLVEQTRKFSPALVPEL